MVNQVRQCIEQGKYSSAAFLDVQQAFDKVWHRGLLHKIKSKLPHNFYLLLKSYLEDRVFRVKEMDYSKLRDIKAGVPQGSILGPLFYIILTSDIPSIKGIIMATFADDTAAMYVNRDPTTAKLWQWLLDWKIRVNPQKSNHITFTLNRGSCPPVKIGKETLPQTTTIKYLGIILDCRQTWKEHIRTKCNELTNKTRKLMILLGRKSKLNLENKLLVYKTILKPTWTYGIELLGTASNSNIEILQRYQNSILKLIAQAPWFTKNTEVHEYFQMPTIKQEIRTRSLKYCQKLPNHPNHLARALFEGERPPKRLKRYHILELSKR